MAALRSGDPAAVGPLLANDLQPAAISLLPDLRLALAAGAQLREHGVASLAVHPGLVRTEGVLQFAEHLDMTGSQSPDGVGRAIAALADDPNVLALTGRALTVHALAARYGINVSDVEGVIQAAVGGQAATQVIQGEQLFDLVVRMKPEYRSSEHAIGNLLVPTPSGQQVPISELASIHQGNGASFIYRENNSRYIGVQFSIEGRDLARAVNQAQKAVQSSVKLPQGYRLDWGGEYSEYVEAQRQFAVIGPLAVLLIFMILFALYGNFKFPVTVVIGVLMTEPVGALLALKLTHTTFSVSSVLGLLVLMGVSAETAIIDVSYINKLRLEGQSIRKATLEGSLIRLRPIMMTALVACLGLLPAALSTGVGSDSQKPFAIVIVAGLISRLFLGRIVSPVLYQMVAREGDVLQV